MQKDKRPLKKSMKRMLWFIAAYALVAILVATILVVCTNVPQWLNMIVCIVLAGAMYLLFLWICARIDKRKKEKEDAEGKKSDPFSD